MTIASATAGTTFVVGDTSDDGRSVWLSPALVGLGAPIVLGLVLVPQMLEGATVVVVLLLALLLALAVGAYLISILMPGEPSGFRIEPADRVVVIVRRGLLASSEITVAFAEVARIGAARGVDRDGYQFDAVEMRTKSGESWIVPAEVDDADIAAMQRIVGTPAKSR